MADETNLGGRPYTGRDARLEIRISPEHKELIKSAAKDRNINLAVFFERLCDRFDLIEEILDMTDEEYNAA